MGAGGEVYSGIAGLPVQNLAVLFKKVNQKCFAFFFLLEQDSGEHGT